MDGSETDGRVRELKERIDAVDLEFIRILNERARLVQESVAAGADGLLVESHHEPQTALCDAEQALPVEELMSLRESLRPFAQAMGR